MIDYERISQLQKKTGTLAVATVVRTYGSTPLDIGSKMAIMPDGSIEGTIGGGPVEKAVIEEAVKLMEKGGFAYKEYRLLPEDEDGIGTQCGGNMDVFIEITGQPESILILGGGHIGLSLYKVCQVLGFYITVVDDREEFSKQDRFPGANVVRMNYDNPALKKLAGKTTSVVIVTHGHGGDAKCLKNMINSQAGYVGMIGSKRKVMKLKEMMIKDGITQEALEKVYTPIGLDIGAETPGEIAISIIAEILNVQKKGAPSQVGMGRKL